MLDTTDTAVDEQGTSQDGARSILESFINKGFEGSQEAAALVLGRPEEELTQHLTGDQDIDDDLIMKVRGIAQERGIEIE